jgi:phenylacetate-coenzyme A ligase PaaK-like adenylate-forming protein
MRINFKFTNRLFSKKVYSDNTDELFCKAMKENVLFQYNNCPEYKRILDAKQFNPNNITTMEDIINLPFIPTAYLKTHRMVSKESSLITATSSGTSGKKSIIKFDFSSLWRGLKMVLSVCKYHKLLSIKGTHYILFAYKPHKGNKTAITKTATASTLFAPALSKTYALNFTQGEYKLDLESLKKKLIELSKKNKRIRTIGFPAYTYFLLKNMKEENIFLKFKKGSKVTIGGGWKQFYADEVNKEDFYNLVYEVLGIEEKDIIEYFGAVEHPILYTDCNNHHFHVPVYSRVIIRNPVDFGVVRDNEIGLLNLLTPMLKNCPIQSIMTDDLAILHLEECGCGIKSPWVEIIGRVGMADIKTCAAGAEDYLKEGSNNDSI